MSVLSIHDQIFNVLKTKNFERTKGLEQPEASSFLNHWFEKSTHTEYNSNGSLKVILRIFVVKNTDVIQLILH